MLSTHCTASPMGSYIWKPALYSRLLDFFYRVSNYHHSYLHPDFINPSALKSFLSSPPPPPTMPILGPSSSTLTLLREKRCISSQLGRALSSRWQRITFLLPPTIKTILNLRREKSRLPLNLQSCVPTLEHLGTNFQECIMWLYHMSRKHGEIVDTINLSTIRNCKSL